MSKNNTVLYFTIRIRRPSGGGGGGSGSNSLDFSDSINSFYAGAI